MAIYLTPKEQQIKKVINRKYPLLAKKLGNDLDSFVAQLSTETAETLIFEFGLTLFRKQVLDLMKKI